jgi:hypothetical protein
MEKTRIGFRSILLSIVILLSILYSSILAFTNTLTGKNRVDGSIGVLFGLYICSHPVAFFVDLLFYRSLIREKYASRGSLGFWVSVNSLLLLFGWVIIVIGATRFTMPG